MPVALIVSSSITGRNILATAPEDATTGLERIIRYGQIIQSQNANSSHTLFGALPVSMEIPPPRLPDCPLWPLIIQLEHEKEVTGMYLSGHPLDHYKFEMKHYGVISIADFNEFKESIRMQANPGKTFRLIGLVADAQHKVSRQGNKYGNFVIEDYSGKTEIILFSEDYLKFTPLLQFGTTVFLTGYFKPRYNRDEFEFKVLNVSLVETVRKHLTRQLTIEVSPKDISEDMIRFVEKNLQLFPGKSTLKFTISEPKSKSKISLITLDNGFEMNEEMIDFLQNSPELEVQVLTA